MWNDEEVYNQYYDTAGNYHWTGTYSGEHTVRINQETRRIKMKSWVIVHLSGEEDKIDNEGSKQTFVNLDNVAFMKEIDTGTLIQFIGDDSNYIIVAEPVSTIAYSTLL